MDREYAIVLAAGVIGLAIAGASRAEAPVSETAIQQNGNNAAQEYLPLGAVDTDPFPLPAWRTPLNVDMPVVTPWFTDRSRLDMICACPTPIVLPPAGTSVG